ncbi:MAG: O-antigen ligase family protein [Pigmentiphaga sp.]|nr:O-antigen ligase family protein [Pigmentiphaga sp.]
MHGVLRYRWSLLCVGLLIAIVVGFPLIRTIDLFADNTVADETFSEGSRLMQLIMGSAFALAGLLAWHHGRDALHTLRRINPFLLLFCVWAATTILWSPYPVVTLKRSIQLVGVILVGLCLCLPFVRQDYVIKVLCNTLTVLLGLSVVVVVVIPEIGVDSMRDGGWRGLMWHKNTLGMVACFTSLLWVDRLWSRSVHFRTGVFLLLFTVAMVVLSRSATALVSTVIGVAVYMLARRRYLGGVHLLAVLSCAGLALAAVAGLIVFIWYGRLPGALELAAPLFSLLGKSMDLTGRTDLWRYVMLDVARHPVLGIGYGAFWLNIGSPSQYIIDAVNWIPLQAHNGYVDILNEVGAVGFGLFLGLMAWHLVCLVRLSAYDRSAAALHWAMLLLIVVTNFSESEFFRGFTFQGYLFIFSSMLVSAHLGRVRQYVRQEAAGA